jgi:DNA-directed RNA polymerase specialized sigma24 family protein
MQPCGAFTSEEGDVQEEVAENIKEPLSPDEVKTALDALTPKDIAVLSQAADFLCFINGLDQPDELLQEALTRALAGQRKCRRNLAFVPFLYGSMRSIASAAAKAAKRSRIDPFADLEEAEEAEQLSADAVDLVDPERLAVARDALQKLNEIFKDDEEVLIVIESMASGLKGDELRKSLGLSKTEHDTIRKRMHRRSKPFAKIWSDQ